ncbi:MAG TPA: hypothetical protein VG269_08035 [Tepidisphaeraceae bacterium]|nr:hypothetical protein [Tepidisphaeraceae bacterium]
MLAISEYMPFWEIEKLFSTKPDETPIEVLRETYKAYFIDADPYKFDKTLFHFLIKRLGKAKDRFAIDHCKTLLERQPQETQYVLSYFSTVGAAKDVESALATFIESKEAVYHYQLYQIFEWTLEWLRPPSDAILSSARARAFDGGVPPFLRSVCRKVLGSSGNVADLERIERAYADAGSPLEQGEIICCLERMEKGRRNAFFARIAGDNEWTTLATRWVKGAAARKKQLEAAEQERVML